MRKAISKTEFVKFEVQETRRATKRLETPHVSQLFGLQDGSEHAMAREEPQKEEKRDEDARMDGRVNKWDSEKARSKSESRLPHL